MPPVKRGHVLRRFSLAPEDFRQLRSPGSRREAILRPDGSGPSRKRTTGCGFTSPCRPAHMPPPFCANLPDSHSGWLNPKPKEVAMQRQLISSGSPFEKPIGFSRAVRVGNAITVSGTAPIAPGGGTAYPGDLYRQTRPASKSSRMPSKKPAAAWRMSPHPHHAGRHQPLAGGGQGPWQVLR
jgi:hypothetical protein